MNQEPFPWWNRIHRGGLSVALAALLAAQTWSAEIAVACDLCAIYTATELQEGRTGLRLGVGQQFTRFATLQRGGDEVPNPANEWMESSITQVLLGYNFTQRIGAQLNLPIISRNFRRLTGDGVKKGDETGFGDLSLLADFVPYSAVGEDSVVRLSVFAGLKLPSGDSSRLREETEEEDEPGGHHGDDGSIFGNPFLDPKRPRFSARHSDTADFESGVHGHDLALGSGSVDGILGLRLFSSWKRIFVSGSVQYLLRTEGDFDYQYANDLLWSVGPGVYVLLGHNLFRRDFSLAWQTVLSGEAKGKDSLDGDDVDDTAMTSIYIGPGLTFTWGSSLSAELLGELPVLQNNSSLQIVPDYRLKGGITWRF